MRDNHLHTYFSYDSDTDFRDYLEHYDGEIVTTEHLDFSNLYPYDGDLFTMIFLIMSLIPEK